MLSCLPHSPDYDWGWLNEWTTDDFTWLLNCFICSTLSRGYQERRGRKSSSASACEKVVISCHLFEIYEMWKTRRPFVFSLLPIEPSKFRLLTTCIAYLVCTLKKEKGFTIMIKQTSTHLLTLTLCFLRHRQWKLTLKLLRKCHQNYDKFTIYNKNISN